MDKVVTRFAPSPTGYLHIGGARTALFNWLFARQAGGDFLLRIEDTDKARNQEETVQPILDGLRWLGLDHDGDVVSQSDRIDRHREVALALLKSGHAYRCYVELDELDRMRKTAMRENRAFKFESPWRDVTEDRFEGRGGLQFDFVIRLKMPRTGSTTIDDLVQGPVTVQNEVLDDMIIMRSDGTPTYMLAAVVDDHDMGVTHVIRGDDHLNNAFRQLQIIRAMGWPEPKYAHIPLIHDESGKKLSKRHGAAGAEWYQERGYTSDAVFNYLLRMGWGHGDHEIFSREDAIKLFSLDAVGKAPARLDLKRLDHLNGVYIRDMPEDQFFRAIVEFGLKANDTKFIDRMVPLVKERSKTLKEAADYIDMAWIAPTALVEWSDGYLREYFDRLLQLWSEDQTRINFSAEEFKAVADEIATRRGVKLKHVVTPLRMAITGSRVSPPLFETMAILGWPECRDRFNFALGSASPV